MRDFDNEYQAQGARRYAYDFDHVVRRFMMRTLEPFFLPGKALELGCFEGDTTRLYAERFNDVTVLEAAASLIEVARQRVPTSVKFIHSTIETARLDQEYDQIFLVHTLEHLDDPVAALERIGRWLSPRGRLFVVVPNANAASRQIAVHMGLVSHQAAVTEAERTHGHRITYGLDTLERDVRAAGLKVISRGGIFFKPFANFQFDQLIKHDIIDDAYLEGCYEMGMIYPDLSASVYTVCMR
jgi:2-polyprenyl-3-methyl-5-hydroxy-6-metoxy-1,4-benzoquinol methylase